MKLKKYTAIAITIFILSYTTCITFADTTGNTSADITFAPGTLTLAEMSSISFGTHTISSEAQIYPARESNVFLDIHDLRGTGEGWNVTALASTFRSGGSSSLPGAVITFANGSTSTDQPAGNSPTVVPIIQLDCDGTTSAPIATASVNQGLGNWSIKWVGVNEDNTNATLQILGGVATTGAHTATITWTLADTP